MADSVSTLSPTYSSWLRARQISQELFISHVTHLRTELLVTAIKTIQQHACFMLLFGLSQLIL